MALLGTRSTSLLVCLLVLCAVPAHARAAGLVDEVKIGVLDHDVPDLWSGFRAEPNSVDMNVEALLSPKVSFAGHTAAGNRRIDQHGWCHQHGVPRRPLAV